MAKVNLTRKSLSDQMRILNDYLIRRAQHNNQGEVTIDQLINRFRHNRCYTNKAKSAFLLKLLRTLEQDKKHSGTVEVEN